MLFMLSTLIEVGVVYVINSVSEHDEFKGKLLCGHKIADKHDAALFCLRCMLLMAVCCCVVVACSTTTAETFVDKSYQNAFMKRMHKQRQADQYTDVTLQSSDVDIRCHRNVLAAASDYFNAMFRCDLKESTSDTIQMNMQPTILTRIVDYIYTGEIQLTVDTVESLVEACDVLQLDTLKTACENLMVKHVDPVNCIGFYKFSALYHLDKLQHKAKRMVQSEFKVVAFMDEFKELSCTEVIECIKSDEVNVASEDIVFDAVLCWVGHDLVNRKSTLETIIENVRLPYCTGDYLQHMSDMLTPNCFKYLHEAMAFQLATVHRHQISSCRTVPRTNMRMKSCLVVIGGHTETTNGEYKKHYLCNYYEEDTSCWKPLTTLPQSVGRKDSVCYTDRGLVVTGGYEGGAMDQCLLFDIARKKWETMPPLITKRYFHRCVSLDDCVYVVGGVGVDNKVLASVECLNQKSRQWSSLPDMAHAVWFPMVTSYRKKIFVFGGIDAQDKHLWYPQVFDTTQNKWSTLSAMPVACRNGAAVSLNDFIYVVGGYSRTCLKYQPASDVWTTLSQPQQQHGYAPAVVWRGSILLAAGDGAEQKPSAIEQFDPLTNTWSDSNIAQLKEQLTGHHMFNVDLHGL